MTRRGINKLLVYRTFFVTTTCLEWINVLDFRQTIDIINNNIIFYCKKFNSSIIGYVIMPNHIHFIIHFHEENRLGEYMRDFKKMCAKEIKDYLSANDDQLFKKLEYHDRRGQTFKLWIGEYDHVHLFSRKVASIKLNYIHNNPVKKGLVKCAEDFEHSSARLYIHGEDVAIPILHFNEVF